MDALRNEILELVKITAQKSETVENAKHYLEGTGRFASMKEMRIRFIEFLIQDGSAMGFDANDDVGDIVYCMDDIAEHFHLLISDSWLAGAADIAGCLRKLGERWGRNGVNLLWIEDPKHRMFPVYAVEAEAVPAILAQAAKADIPMREVSEMPDEDEDEEDEIDWTLG